MIRIKDIIVEASPFGLKCDFDQFLAHIFFPQFGCSDLQYYVRLKLGPLPKWGAYMSINLNDEGIVTSASNGPALITYEDAYFYFRDIGRFTSDEELTETYLSWFAEKGFPDPAENPEGFVIKLVELYPQLSPFIEII